MTIVTWHMKEKVERQTKDENKERTNGLSHHRPFNFDVASLAILTFLPDFTSASRDSHPLAAPVDAVSIRP